MEGDVYHVRDRGLSCTGVDTVSGGQRWRRGISADMQRF